MRILVPSIIDPAVAKGGAWTATRGLLGAIRTAVRGVSIECIPLPELSSRRHRLRQLSSIAGALRDPSIPAKVRFTMDKDFRTKLKHALSSRRPDLLLINGSDLLWVLDDVPSGLPVAMVFLNIEHELYAAQIDTIPAALRGVGHSLLRDLHALEQADISTLARIQGAVFLSAADQKWATLKRPQLDSILVPPLFDYVRRARTRPCLRKTVLGMFADFSWWPNQQALKWFCEEVLPYVSELVELHLWGSHSEKAARGNPGTTAYGFVADPRDAFQAVDVMIAPGDTGAGVKVKVAESLFNLTPLIATSAAMRGFDLPPDPAVRICNSAAEWIEFIRSPDLEVLANTKVSAAIACRFAPGHLNSTIRDFLGRLTAPAVPH